MKIAKQEINQLEKIPNLSNLIKYQQLQRY